MTTPDQPPPPLSRQPVHDVPPHWLDAAARRHLRRSPRLGRLVTAIDMFTLELAARQARPAGAGPWSDAAGKLLDAARAATNERRLDDGWEFLHAAQRQSLDALTVAEATGLVTALGRESAAKLTGWRGKAAADDVTRVKSLLHAGAGASGQAQDALAPPAVRTGLAAVKRLLDDNSTNAYLRLRLVGQRLVLSTALLGLVLVLLFAVAARHWLPGTAFPDVTVLHDRGAFAVITLLGALGALLSFSIGAMASGAQRRIYELANGRFASTAARVLVGASAAVVLAVAVQSEVVGLNHEWLLILAVAAGFSERFVKRIIESLSADAEKPAAPADQSEAAADGGKTE